MQRVTDVFFVGLIVVISIGLPFIAVRFDGDIALIINSLQWSL